MNKLMFVLVLLSNGQVLGVYDDLTVCENVARRYQSGVACVAVTPR